MKIQCKALTEIIIRESDGAIAILVDGDELCRFIATDPTGFVLQVGDKQSFSNEEQECSIIPVVIDRRKACPNCGFPG